MGVAPGLTNLLAVAVRATGHEPTEVLVVLGVGESHGRAARLAGMARALRPCNGGTIGS